jgi:hypothetical protein
MKSSVWKRNRGKILIAIAALLIALAAAYGSGAFFTAQATNNGNVFTAGTLSLTPAGASLDVGPLFPGTPQSGSMTVTNNNAADCELYLNQSNLSGPLVPEVYVTIRDGGGVVWGPGLLSSFPGGSGLDVGTLTAGGGSVTLTWEALLPETGVNQDALQGATMGCDYTWTLVAL